MHLEISDVPYSEISLHPSGLPLLGGGQEGCPAFSSAQVLAAIHTFSSSDGFLTRSVESISAVRAVPSQTFLQQGRSGFAFKRQAKTCAKYKRTERMPRYTQNNWPEYLFSVGKVGNRLLF